jgi:uncharacterized protein YlzI (FlbEa/FlbD family)
MIRLIRQDGVEILLNVDTIKSIQGMGPTVITMTNGEKLEVKNHPRDITEKIKAYKAGIEMDDHNGLLVPEEISKDKSQ